MLIDARMPCYGLTTTMDIYRFSRDDDFGSTFSFPSIFF